MVPTGSFAAEQPQLLADFVAMAAEMNEMWNAGDRRDEMLPVIAQDAGMDQEAAAAVIDNFRFLSPEQQLSDDWLGSRVTGYFDGVASMFQELGNIPSVHDNYAEFVDLAPLQSAAACRPMRRAATRPPAFPKVGDG